MTKLTAFIAIVSLAVSMNARAQLTSVDGGLAVQDYDGLMFANVVDIVQEAPDNNTNQLNWVASLNGEDYGGYNDWSLATADSTYVPNNTTNQLGYLFQLDCQNNGCAPFTAVTTALQTSWTHSGYFMSSSVYTGGAPGCGEPYFCSVPAPYMYYVPVSGVGGHSAVIPWDEVSIYGDAIAVRNINYAPELDGSGTLAALTLLCGGALVFRAKGRLT